MRDHGIEPEDDPTSKDQHFWDAAFYVLAAAVVLLIAFMLYRLWH